MSSLSKAEVDKIMVMYEGDKNRDASSKIRGFLFQDYVTIMCLLQDKVEYVCSEYLEDVDVFYEDGRFDFIQVKYYPNKSPDKKVISTDLYYQYLRLQMLQSTLKAKPCLFIHRETVVVKPTIQEMKNYVGLERVLPKTVDYSIIQDPEKWLRDNIYTIDKKENQKATFFEKMASEQSIESFINQLSISPQLSICEYKEKLMERLAKEFPNTSNSGDEEKWKLILLGVSILYIQRRYALVDSDFNKLRIAKNEFCEYMTESVKNKKESTIVSYLVGIASELYGEIINNNPLSDLQIHILNLIYHNTVTWLENIANTVGGQYKLLNTFSTEDERKVSEYKVLSLDARLLKMAECRSSYIVFLSYMWKIILNLCQEKIKLETDITMNPDLFKPNYYIEQSVTEYVCFNFPDDKYVSYSIILPRVGGDFNGVKRKIVGRMIKMSQKPEKWFFENNKILKGKNYYNYSTAEINENPTVADLGEDSFYIECMDCIGIDETEWNIPEECSECIFSEKCVNGRG